MAFPPSSFCHPNCSSSPSLLPQVESFSQDAPTSQFSALNHRAHIRQLYSLCTAGNELASYSKKYSWICAQSQTFSPILSSGNSFANSSRYSTRSSCVYSLSGNPSGNRSFTRRSTRSSREISRFTPSSFHFESRRRSPLARQKSSQETGASTDTEVDAEVGNEENGLASREATAAVTVAAITSDAEAISRVVDTVEEQKKISSEDSPAAKSFISKELEAIYAKCQQWQWKNSYSINYVVQGSGPPVVLVHGFGASIGHWRRNIGVLSEANTVYAIDLLGLGASTKPSKFTYTMETWAELLIDFLKDIVGSSAVLVGNSIGSLACLLASAEAPTGLVRGTVLLNCAGGMNNKAITDDWRLKLALPLLWLIDFLLSRRSIANQLFSRIRSRANIKTVLQSIYDNKAAVDDELVEVILRPADTPGALDAFISIITGPPGPKPQTLIPKISTPVLLIWGDKDPFTPINGPVGKYFAALATTTTNVQLYLLPNVGHCPHDDRPELVHEKLVPWLASLPT